MKKILLYCAIFIMGQMYCQVGIGTTTPNPKSMLEVSSTSNNGMTYKGFMPPRVPNLATRDAINPGYADYGLMVFVTDDGNGKGALQIWDGDNWENITSIFVASPEVWINEFHYTNAGTDEGEFIEIAGPAGMDLSTYSIELYNGVNGHIYNPLKTLTGIIPNQFHGIGTLSFSYLPNDIQNGDPDGIALINSGIVVQFISYGGVITATNGTANGMTSTDIGVKEPGNTPVGKSLQLKGTGIQYNDFTWTSPSTASPDSINTGQTIN